MNNWKKIVGTVIGAFIVIVFVGISTGCGGGSSPDNAPVTIPPEEVENTLLGTDENGDGVRDDIEVYIAETYPDSEKIRMVLTEHAKIIQFQLADANDEELSVQHSEEADHLLSCLFYINPEDAHNILPSFIAEILNTEKRSVAYIRYDEQLGGKVFTLLPDDGSTCPFDVDSLPN